MAACFADASPHTQHIRIAYRQSLSLQIDITKVTGTGPYGRITPTDVQKAAGIAPKPAPAAPAPAVAAAPAPAAARPAAAAAPLPAGASVVAFTGMQVREEISPLLYAHSSILPALSPASWTAQAAWIKPMCVSTPHGSRS